jgi:tetratricopeptide (TPR) repeat protein
MSYLVALTHFAQGRYDRAIAVLQEALQIEPEYADSMALMARCYAYLGDKKMAVAFGREAVKLDPTNANAHASLALVYVQIGKPDWGLTAGRNAIHLGPEDPYCYMALAFVYLHMNRLKDALRIAEQGLQFDPEDEGLLDARAAALMELGWHSEAARAVGESLSINPENETAQAILGYQKLQAREYEQAKQIFLDALRLDPNSEYAREGLLMALRTTFLPYRVALAFGFWNKKFGQSGFLVVGILVVTSRVLVEEVFNAEAIGVFRYILGSLLAIISVILLFAGSFANLALFFSKEGRIALHRDERTWVYLFLATLGLAGLSFGLAIIRKEDFDASIITSCIGIFLMLLVGLTDRLNSKRVFNWVAFAIATMFGVMGILSP